MKLDLKDLRTRRGLTQEAIAVLAGTDAATVSRIERGVVQAKPETVVRLAQALGMSARRMQRMLEPAEEPKR